MTHQLLPAASMNCPACGEWTDGIHSLSEEINGKWKLDQYCGACCPACRPADPLPEREIETTAGVQAEMFGGGE